MSIRPRKLQLDTRESVPRHWFGGSPVATHLVNAVSLVFPAGERFFVRSVHHYLSRIEDEALLRDVRGFAGQEGRHARAHEQDFERLRAQGYEIDRFLRAYERVAYGLLEPLFPPALRLAATAAAEHFTAILAERALSGPLLAAAHPEMQRLLKWHAAEEIEHKHVAFDVLQLVAPSYPVRMAGMAFAAAVLGVCWAAAAAMLLRQDGYGPLRALRELRHLRRLEREAAQGGGAGLDRSIVGGVFLRGMRQYAQRGFHPRQVENDDLAAAYLRGAGLEPAPAAPEAASGGPASSTSMK